MPDSEQKHGHPEPYPGAGCSTVAEEHPSRVDGVRGPVCAVAVYGLFGRHPETDQDVP